MPSSGPERICNWSRSLRILSVCSSFDVQKSMRYSIIHFVSRRHKHLRQVGLGEDLLVRQKCTHHPYGVCHTCFFHLAFEVRDKHTDGTTTRFTKPIEIGCTYTGVPQWDSTKSHAATRLILESIGLRHLKHPTPDAVSGSLLCRRLHEHQFP